MDASTWLIVSVSKASQKFAPVRRLMSQLELGLGLGMQPLVEGLVHTDVVEVQDCSGRVGSA